MNDLAYLEHFYKFSCILIQMEVTIGLAHVDNIRYYEFHMVPCYCHSKTVEAWSKFI